MRDRLKSLTSNFLREQRWDSDFWIEDISKKVYIFERTKGEFWSAMHIVLKKSGKVFRGTLKRWKYSILQRCKVHAYLTVQASAVVAHLASDAPLFRHRSVQLFARLVKDLGSFCSIIFARRVIPGVVSTLVPLHLGCMLQPCLKLHQSINGEFR